MSVIGSQKYDITKQDLEKLYCEECLSAKQIADKLGIETDRTIRNYIRKYNLSRNRSQAAIARWNGSLDFKKNSNYEKEIIIGELIGDGNLTIDKRSEIGIPYYRHSSKHEEYLEWLSKQILSLEWNSINTVVHSQVRKNGEPIVSYRLRSQVHPELKEIYDMFYENGVKRIPKDLQLTPIMLRQWFIGDGTAGLFSAGKKRDGTPKKCWQMCLYACAYSKEDVERLQNQLSNMDIVSTITMGPGRYRLRIAAQSHEKFYEIIGNCPIESFEYKWK